MIDESDRQRHSEHGRDEEQNIVQREKRKFAVNDIGASGHEDGESELCREKEDQEERGVNREFPSGTNLVLGVENRVNDKTSTLLPERRLFSLFPRRPTGLALRARPLHQSRLRNFFLMSRLPLLSQEGSCASRQFIHSFTDRAHNHTDSVS
jgi:hypothetical protein